VIDIHCHVLPGVDDGPQTLADAVAMCRLAVADGCRTLVATPHQRHPIFEDLTRERLERAWRELTAALDGTPQVLLGAEVRVDSDLFADLERDPPEVLPLAGSRYLLVELPRIEAQAPPAEDVVHELVVAGWRPVLAHPEMLPWLGADLERVAGLVAGGAMLQVTAAALTGDFGRLPAELGWQLVEAGLVHFVASDAHSPTWRPPGLAAVREALERRGGAALATRLLVDNPACVLANAPLPSTAPLAGATP
jgi:protein-tyrosine phosphatase